MEYLPSFRQALTDIFIRKNVPLNVRNERPIKEDESIVRCGTCGSHNEIYTYSVNLSEDHSKEELLFQLAGITRLLYSIACSIE